jgi:FkbM family methyltransferase
MELKKDLIFDIGMHVGEDTIHYLKEGYNVVAVEANPLLAERGAKQFKKQIASGQLIILNKGIAGKEATLPFYVNHRLSDWSSFDKATGTRDNTAYHVIDVPCTTTQILFEQYGIPFYLKVDIEGFDHYCLLDIPNAGIKPRYVSCEAVYLDWLDILKAKGYTKFKLINQGNEFAPVDINQEMKPYFAKYEVIKNGLKMRLQKFISFKHLYGSSGPFGEATRGAWLSYEKVREVYLAFFQNEKGKPLNTVSWFDFHATF